MQESDNTNIIAQKGSRGVGVVPFFLYALLVCSTMIAMPQGGTTYLFQRFVQVVELFAFLFLNIRLLRQYHSLRIDRFQRIVHFWWFVIVISSFITVRPFQLSEVNLWLNVCVFLLMVNVYWESSGFEHMRMLAVLLSVLVYLNGLLFVMFPDGLWVDTDWIGSGDKTRYLFGNYNQTGVVILVSLLVNGIYSIVYHRGKLNMFLIMIVGTATVAAMGSTTSTIGLLIVCLYYIFRRFVRHPYMIVNIFIALYVGFFAMVVWGGSNIDEMPQLAAFVENVLGKDSTFTARVPLWFMSVKLILSQPFLGYGPQNPEWMVQNIGGSGPHNLWLMFMLQGGLLLTGLFVLILLKIFKTLYKARLQSGAFALVCCCVLLLMSLFETYHIVCVFILLTIAYYSKNFDDGETHPKMTDERGN